MSITDVIPFVAGTPAVPFTSGVPSVPAPPGGLASTEHATAMAADLEVVDVCWPVRVEWHVLCHDTFTSAPFPTLAAAEAFATADDCRRPHTITLLKLDEAA